MVKSPKLKGRILLEKDGMSFLGGKHGGGTQLTEHGRSIVRLFRQGEEGYQRILDAMVKGVADFDALQDFLKRAIPGARSRARSVRAHQCALGRPDDGLVRQIQRPASGADPVPSFLLGSVEQRIGFRNQLLKAVMPGFLRDSEAGGETDRAIA